MKTLLAILLTAFITLYIATHSTRHELKLRDNIEQAQTYLEALKAFNTYLIDRGDLVLGDPHKERISE
jgi:hypothetical protein